MIPSSGIIRKGERISISVGYLPQGDKKEVVAKPNPNLNLNPVNPISKSGTPIQLVSESTEKALPNSPMKKKRNNKEREKEIERER